MIQTKLKNISRLIPERVIWNIPGSICLLVCAWSIYGCLPYFANRVAVQKTIDSEMKQIISGYDTTATVELIHWHSTWYGDTIRIKRSQLNSIIIGQLSKTNDSLRRVGDMPSRMPLLKRIDSLERLTKKQSETIKAFIKL